MNQAAFGDVGDILLTGATGFLGMHILNEFLLKYPGRVYCLVRRGRADSVSQRLKTMLVYYFNRAYEELFDARVSSAWRATSPAAARWRIPELKFDTLINCAACVKHFVADDSLERINVRGVENLIALCRKTGRRLIQISTVSIAGEGKNGRPPRDRRLAEYLSCTSGRRWTTPTFCPNSSRSGRCFRRPQTGSTPASCAWAT